MELRGQLVGVLTRDGAAIGVEVHPGQAGKTVVQHAEDREQLVEGVGHDVAVGQEDAAGGGVIKRALVAAGEQGPSREETP